MNHPHRIHFALSDSASRYIAKHVAVGLAQSSKSDNTGTSEPTKKKEGKTDDSVAVNSMLLQLSTTKGSIHLFNISEQHIASLKYISFDGFTTADNLSLSNSYSVKALATGTYYYSFFVIGKPATLTPPDLLSFQLSRAGGMVEGSKFIATNQTSSLNIYPIGNACVSGQGLVVLNLGDELSLQNVTVSQVTLQAVDKSVNAMLILVRVG